MDRSVARYQHQPFGALQAWQTTYDGVDFATGLRDYGLLTSKTDPIGVTSSSSYNAIGLVSGVSFSDSTPARSYTFDADGRQLTVQSNAFRTDQYTYNADGRLTTHVESSGGGATSPATITYGYYPNGARSQFGITSA